MAFRNSFEIHRTYQKLRARLSNRGSSPALKFTIPTGFFDATLFAVLAVRPTLLAAMTGIPHVTLNRERKGGIAEFVAVRSETKQRTFSWKKIAKTKLG
jgi:hypothetical protein